MTKSESSNAERVVTRLDYDFSQFSFDHFCEWLQEKTRQRFLFVGLDFMSRSKLFGAWVSAPLQTQVFLFEQTLSPLHREHVLLHEIGHFLCSHQTDRLSSQDLDEILSKGTILKTPLYRSLEHAELMEQEAETVAKLILEKAIGNGYRRQSVQGRQHFIDNLWVS